MAQTDPNPDFATYLDLMRGYCPELRGMSVYDREFELLWQGGDGSGDTESLRTRMQSLVSGETRAETVDTPALGRVHLLRLDDEYGDLSLVLCLYLDARDKAEGLSGQAALLCLGELLRNDRCQAVALASKEDELDYMTDELTRRYEELNLIYKAEDQAINIYHGRELLRQLVSNSSRFLNVDIIYLYIADKDIVEQRFRGDQPVERSEDLFACLRDRVLPILARDSHALVVNHPGEALRLGVECELPFKLVASPIVNIDSGVVGMLAIASRESRADFSNSDRNLLDVMAKKASKIAQSHFDPLTGLENSNSFALILRDLLKKSRGRQAEHAIVNIDIDRMAVVNDISGREAGDWLIREVGKTLSRMVRGRDVVARTGSDKFGVLLENCDLRSARNIMKKISHAVSAIEMEWQGEPHQVSVSIGIAPINDNAQSVTSLLNAAETARDLSKQRGRNAIHVLEMGDSDLLERKEQIRWVNRIQAALREDRFVLFAQLIEPLKSRELKSHFEILLRMVGDDGEIIAPDRFVPAAEIFYLMASLDYWVIDRTLSELEQINRDSGGCRVSINISGQSLGDPLGLGAYIENKFEQYQLDPADICFEITESAAIANLEDARRFIDHIHELGCRISLDDFGTGLSSFAYLKNLQVDYVKIDGGFVRDILDDPVSESMVAAINQVGHAMNLKIVAEFVENDAIRSRLAEIGIDYGQGYGIGKPVRFSELPRQRVRTA